MVALDVVVEVVVLVDVVVEVVVLVDVLVEVSVVLLVVVVEVVGNVVLVNWYVLNPGRNLIRSHAVANKMHHPSCEYVIELHSAFCTQRSWHVCRSATLPVGETSITSPAA